MEGTVALLTLGLEAPVLPEDKLEKGLVRKHC
jgi:hypothetical protein